MSNAIRISRTGTGANNFRLQSKRISISYERSPVVAALPGVDPLLFDLGQWKVSIIIEGVASFPGTDLNDSDAVPIADKDDLEVLGDSTASNPWHSQTITITDNSAPTAVTYTIKISKIQLEKLDAQSYYTFNLQAIGFRA